MDIALLDTDTILVVGTTTLVTILFTLLLRRTRQTAARPLPHPTYDKLKKQPGQAIESGRKLHIGLGRGSLNEATVPATVAAQSALDYVTKESIRGEMVPAVTVGDSTLLPIAVESVQTALGKSQISPADARFVANSGDPYAYAAGTADVVAHEDVAGSLILGHYGSEIALMTAAGDRVQANQIVGSDDPVALAIAAASTPDLLIGEQFLAADAYLDEEPAHVASLYVQNILRAGIIFFITLTILLQLLGIQLPELIG